MDHIFEQKLVRENHQLQFELAKLNKQIKQLQEKVVGYEQMISQVEVSEGIRRGERTDAARLKAANRLQQYDPQNNRVAGGIENLDLNTSYRPMANALDRGREAAQTRLSNLTLASGRAMEKTSRSLLNRAVRGSERQAINGGTDPQLKRVVGAISGGISTRSPSPGDSASVNAQMAREGILGKRVGRRVAASVASRGARAAATAAGQQAMAAKAKALGMDAGQYMKQQAQERKKPTTPPKIGFQEQMLSQLDEGEMRNRRLAASLNKQGKRIGTGNTRLAAMDDHIKNVAATQGSGAAQAADSALWQQRGETSRGLVRDQQKAVNLERGLNTGIEAVKASRARRVARGSFSDKPKEQAQADRIKNIGTGIETQNTQLFVQNTPKTFTAPNGGQNITMGTTARLGSISSDSLAAQGKLPTKKFGATAKEQIETLSSMRAKSADKRADRAAIQSYAAKARNKANQANQANKPV